MYNAYHKYNKDRLSLLFSENDSDTLQAFLIDFIVFVWFFPYLHILLSGLWGLLIQLNVLLYYKLPSHRFRIILSKHNCTTSRQFKLFHLAETLEILKKFSSESKYDLLIINKVVN